MGSASAIAEPAMRSLLALYGATLAVLHWQRQGLLAGAVLLGLFAWLLRQHRIQGGTPAPERWALIVSAVGVSAAMLEMIPRLLRTWHD